MNTKRRFTKVVIITLLLSIILISGCVKKSFVEELSEPKSAVSTKSGDWPMFRHDAEHTGTTNEVVEPPLELRWKYNIGITGEGAFLSPAVSGGVVYVYMVSVDGHDWYVSALDAIDGSLKWKYKISSDMTTISHSPAVSDGMVYIGSNALDAGDGSLKWIYQTASSGISSSPAVSGGVVYVSVKHERDDIYLYALYVSSGSLKWRYKIGEPAGELAGSSPAVSGGVVYIGSGDGYVYALDASSGSLKWRYQTGEVISTTVPRTTPGKTGKHAVYSSPAVSGGIVYVGSFDKGSWDGYVHALDAIDGSLKWKYPGYRFVSSPAVSGGVVYIADGYVYALDARDGSLKWKYQTGGRVDSSPAVSGDVVYIGSEDGYLYALDAKDGSLKWKYQTGSRGMALSSPVVAGSMVYVNPGDGYVYAFAPVSNLKEGGRT